MNLSDIVSVLMYASALDLYRRDNARHVRRLSTRERIAMHEVIDWTARPACLDSAPYSGRTNEERDADDAFYWSGADNWPVGLTPEQCGERVPVVSDREPTADGWF